MIVAAAASHRRRFNAAANRARKAVLTESAAAIYALSLVAMTISQVTS